MCYCIHEVCRACDVIVPPQLPPPSGAARANRNEPIPACSEIFNRRLFQQSVLPAIRDDIALSAVELTR